MARQEVTFDEVSAAAIGLQDDGEQVTIETVRASLGTGSPHAIHKHLTAWRASRAKPAEAQKAEIPQALAAALGEWAQQFAHDTGAGTRDALAQAESDMETLLASGEELAAAREELTAEVDTLTSERDQSMATASERAEEIDRLTIELRDARKLATDALVGKAKDQLAIDGKDAQLATLREQIERNVAALATESDARLAAEIKLIGVVTARDNFEAEIKTLRSQLDSAKSERNVLREQVRRLKPGEAA